MLKYLFTIILLVICSNYLFSQVQEYNDLVLSVEKDTIKLEKDLSYYSLTVSNDFLVWAEGYTNQIYYQNLVSGKIKKIDFTEGRGPFEIKAANGLEIIKNNLIILDRQNSKILIYDLNQHTFKNEFKINYRKGRIIYITSSSNKLYAKGSSPSGIYFEIDINSEKITSLKNSFTDQLLSDSRKNIFRSEGSFIVNSDFLITVRFYEPSLYVFDISNQKMSDFEYDETEIEAEYEFNEFGIATYPPFKLSMRVHSAALKPNSNIIYLAREGYTEKYPENNRSVLYQYDYI